MSTRIIQKPKGNVTFFAFDKGQELSEHTTPFDALINVFEGEVIIRIGGRPHHLKRGDAIVCPAMMPHAVRAVKRFKMILTLIRS